MAALGEREPAEARARGGWRRWWRATAPRCCASRTSSRSATTTRSTPTSARWRSTCAGSTPSIPRPRARGCGSWSSTRRWRSARARLESVDREDVDLDASVHAGLREVEDAVAGGERVDRSVEALRALKPDEARALLLKAEGLSYEEIGAPLRLDLHEGQPQHHRGPRALPEGVQRDRGGRGVRALRGRAERARRRDRDERRRWSRSARTCATARPAARRCARCASRARGGSRCSLPFGWLARLLARPDVDARCSTPPRAAAGGSGRPRRSSGCA